jgi:hypothetical protein
MADTVNTQVIHSGSRRYAVHLTNESDGTGESAVTKIDISTLIGPDGTAPSYTVVEEVRYNVVGFNYVVLEWAHTTNDEIAVCGTGADYMDFTGLGGLVDPKSTGGTGDIVLTTDGGGDGSGYDITIVLRLKD